MSEASYATLGLSFAAFCVWLVVRIVNRRELWAKWTMVGVVVMAAAYPLSFGPACWVTARPRLRDFGEVHKAMTVFWPFGRAAGSDTPVGAAVRWWMLVGVPDGYVALAPQTPDGNTRFAHKKGPGPY